MSNDQLTELKQFFVVTLDAALEPIRADVRQLQKDVRQLQDDVMQLKSEVKQLKTNVKQLQVDVKVLQTDVAELRTEIAQLRDEMEDGFAGVGETVERLHSLDEYHAGLLEAVAQKWGHPKTA